MGACVAGPQVVEEALLQKLPLELNLIYANVSEAQGAEAGAGAGAGQGGRSLPQGPGLFGLLRSCALSAGAAAGCGAAMRWGPTCMVDLLP